MNKLIVVELATLLILGGLFPLHAGASEIGKVLFLRDSF